MKRTLGRILDRWIDRFAERVAKRVVSQFFYQELHPSTLLFREAQTEAAAYVKEKMPEALYFPDREQLLRYAVDHISIPGMVLELGVFGGKSIRLVAERTDRPVHGFDSFEGLPEDWAGNKSPRGEFSMGGKLPQVPPNVTLHRGLFEETLPGFMRENEQAIAFAHVDCDLYSSTRTVFQHIGPLLREGTILVFDDYFNFPGWRDHEFRAFQEFVRETGLRYRYLAYGRHQVAMTVLDPGKPDAR